MTFIFEFTLKRKTSKKKFRQKVQEFKDWIKQNRTLPLKDIMGTVRRKLTGHYNYYGVTDNTKAINKYYYLVINNLYKWLNRRSQRRSYTEKGFYIMLNAYKLPLPSIRVNIYDN